MENMNLIELEMWIQDILERWIQDISDKNNKILDVATKIYKDHPELTIREVIEKAKEVIECQK